ncbi:hypothetical protein PHAVU_003G193900 [Phaseolus vulgaris]|uniref:Uncharacterized protein n=1 Tax=Phaseolus vulgaris TaxID=3885 RepID=V7CDI2_PHAVU|nr:hypothetical protein PHAVU_003G193900g [Phaseolus vulgaris]ESW27345.1 hypothetical protein PHAVU_003G193900g [Phaseolus vulgaris]
MCQCARYSCRLEAKKYASRGMQGNNKSINHPTSTRFLSTVSLFSVRVPVLSLQSTSMPAISSMAVILFVIAPCRHYLH